MRSRLKDVVRSGDRGILEELLNRGDSLARRRHTIAFFYLRKGDPRDPELVLNPLAHAAIGLGWQVAGIDAAGVNIEADRMVDPDSVNAMSEEMEALAEEFGVEFDGWECAVLADVDTEK